MTLDKVIQYIHDHHEDSIKELSDLVRFKSVSAQPEKYQAEINDCATWLLDHFHQLGISAQLYPTAGNPVLVARTPDALVLSPESAPTIMLYGHYDVQPPEPFELWKSPPFEPEIRNNNLYARGAADNKGQHFAHIKAIEAYIKTGTLLPCKIIFVIEGEEEVGSHNLYEFIETHKDLLKADFLFISDNGIPSTSCPTITYALRGVSAMEVEITGPGKDLHSGFYGGAVANPAMELCRLLARIHDENGVIQIPEFYKDVLELSGAERESFLQLPETDEEIRTLTGVPRLYGEAGYTTYERRTCRPTVEINGLSSGYQGSGSKTIVPSIATAKLTMRLVPNQNPAKIQNQMEQFLIENCPGTVKIKVTKGHAGAPYLTSPDGPFAQAAKIAVEKAFGHKALIAREGGSIPIINEFKEKLGLDTLLPGLSLPDDNMHSPNEKFSLECFLKGKLMGAYLLHEVRHQLKNSQNT